MLSTTFGVPSVAQEYGVLPYVCALGVPYVGVEAGAHNEGWDIYKLKLQPVIPKGGAAAAALEAQSSDKVVMRKFNIYYGGKPLRVQFGWLKINFTSDNKQYRITLSPIESVSVNAGAFEKAGTTSLLEPLRAVRDKVVLDLASLADQEGATMNLDAAKDFMEPEGVYAPTLKLSYHLKSAHVFKVKPTALNVYEDLTAAPIEKIVNKGAVQAPICRLQVSVSNDFQKVYFNWVADQAAVIIKPEQAERTEQRRELWQEMVNSKLGSLWAARFSVEPDSKKEAAIAAVVVPEEKDEKKEEKEEKKEKKEKTGKRKKAEEGDKPAVPRKPRVKRTAKKDSATSLNGAELASAFNTSDTPYGPDDLMYYADQPGFGVSLPPTFA